MRNDLTYQAVLPAPPFAVESWVRPLPLASGVLAIAAGAARFDAVDVVQQFEGRYLACRMTVDALMAAADDRNAAARLIDRLVGPRPPFAGLAMAQPRIMGILNVTPDSFSDGGRHNAPASAIQAGKSMCAAGADIIDIGGESTRPGAVAVSRNQELARVLPPLTGLKDCGAVLSIDTRHAIVMQRAAGAGAGIINDIAGLREEGALDAATRTGCHAVIMHMQGTPETMQVAPHYEFAPIDVYRFLESRIDAALAAGMPRELLCIDPGFGFGKTVEHNLQLVNWLAMLHGLGVPVLFGASRKSSIASLSAGEPAEARLPGSLAVAMAAIRQGAQILRVHDVAETAQALALELALMRAGGDAGKTAAKQHGAPA